MKIVSVDAVPLAIPFDYGANAPRSLDFCLVRVQTDGGLVGWGEAFSYNCRNAVAAAVRDMIAPLAIGREAGSDLARIEELHLDIQKKLHIFGRFGITAFALSGLDIALWDIAGKASGKPVHRLLGEARRDSVPCYASLLRYGDAGAVARQCARALAEGYAAIKLHEITDPPVAAARNELGAATPLMVDVNCAWSRDEAIAMALQWKMHGLLWLEEPVFPPEDLQGMRRVGEASGIPIASGENFCFANQFLAARDSGALAYAQPSVTKVGGITEFRRIAALGMTLAPHSPYFGPGALATLHLLAGLVPDARFEFYYGQCAASLFGDALIPRNGALPVPRGLGLGADPDARVLERYRA